MRLRDTLFPLLVLFALLTSQISPAYIVFGILAFLWIVAMWRERAPAPSLSSPQYSPDGSLFCIQTSWSRAPGVIVQSASLPIGDECAPVII